jgi:endonuclease YncB( thermonuclease family)
MGNRLCCLTTNSEQINISNFQNYTFDLTPQFSLKDKILLARVVDIYDGDTCTCVIPIHDKYFYKFSIRLAGIDTCEIKAKSDSNKELAKKARKRLYELITNNENSTISLNITRNDLKTILNEKNYVICIRCEDFDKYGRLLAWLYKTGNIHTNYESNDLSFNKQLVDEKLAYEYNGATKLTEEQQICKLNVIKT